MKTFTELQAGLGSALAANREGSGMPHVVIALPSYSASASLLEHYGDRILALEHRYLLGSLMTHRIEQARLVSVCSIAPPHEELDYHRSLGPRPTQWSWGTRVVSLEDPSRCSLAEKLLARPDVLERLQHVVAGRSAFIEPWNVTEHEVAVAERLQVPVNGMDPALWHLGFKGAGRKLFARAGVPLPAGVEDVRTVEDVVRGIAAVRRARPDVSAVVVKHDDSYAGDGNTVVNLLDGPVPADLETIRRRVAALPGNYLAELRKGGIVEELVTGTELTTPSAQVDLLPGGEVVVLATHEQVVGGTNGQVFLGCRFPADPVHAADVARHARAVGEQLAAAGALGRVSVDFVASRDPWGGSQVYALEVNLRKGGTTHPYAALRNLVPGRYDEVRGAWVTAADGGPRSYVCTDNLLDESWVGLAPGAVVRAVRRAGLQLDHRTGVGVVLHMLSGLAIDGRIGLTAIGLDAAHAQRLHDAACRVIAATATEEEGRNRAAQLTP